VGKVVLVVRTYPIRVGGESGPIGLETSFSEIAKSSGVALAEIERTEIGTVSGKTRRIAHFNWEQVRKSALLNGATDIALTFADYLGIGNRAATDFETLLPPTQKFIRDIERVTGCPVSFVSKEFSRTSVIDLRKQPW
jgi:adenylosuccinate synthase